MLRTLSSRLFPALLLLAVTGCAGLMPDKEPLPYHREMNPLPSGPICRVAVLPFVNDSDYPFGGDIASRVFREQLQMSGNHLVVQDGDILDVYQQLRIRPGVAPTLEQLRIIADRVNAQLLITGIVLEMRQDPAPHRTVNPAIIMELQVRDGRTGGTLWKVFHRKKGTDYKKAMHFGTIHTVTGLSGRMATEIINLLFEKGLTQCKE